MNVQRIFVAALFLGMAGTLCTPGVLAQTASQDMKSAGSHTKAAAQDAGSGVSKGSKKAYNKTKRGTKKAYHKTKNKVDGDPTTH